MTAAVTCHPKTFHLHSYSLLQVRCTRLVCCCCCKRCMPTTELLTSKRALIQSRLKASPYSTFSCSFFALVNATPQAQVTLYKPNPRSFHNTSPSHSKPRILLHPPRADGQSVHRMHASRHRFWRESQFQRQSRQHDGRVLSREPFEGNG